MAAVSHWAALKVWSKASKACRDTLRHNDALPYEFPVESPSLTCYASKVHLS